MATKTKTKARAKVSKKVRAKRVRTDYIEEVVHRLENTKTQALLTEAVRLADDVQQHYFELGGALDIIKRGELWKSEPGHQTMHFGEWVAEVFAFKERKAEYLIQIYNALVQAELPWEKVGKLGWIKLRVLATAINAGLKPSVWAEKAATMTAGELRVAVREAVEGKELKSTSRATSARAGRESVRMSFTLVGDQIESVEEALAKAKTEAESDAPGYLLSCIALSYLSEGSKKVGLRDLMSRAGAKVSIETAAKLWPNLDIVVTEQPVKKRKKAASKKK